MNTILAQIKIVLVKTSHPGNIGAAARAMKNMGLSNLVLVKPKIFPAYEADRRASGAIDILEQCTVVETLDEAIKVCPFVVASSAR
jgi:TrmH family RNA methyltransferase